MKKETYTETFESPEGVSVSYENREVAFTKGSTTLKRKIDSKLVSVSVSGNNVVLTAEKPGKRERKLIMSYLAHFRNLITGLNEKYTYKLEACNVHFPMTLKMEKNTILVNNFLGEKIPRKSVILPNVDVEIKGTQITVTSSDREAAGQTAANLERATKVRNRDRRIFQDGIYITAKPMEASQ